MQGEKEFRLDNRRVVTVALESVVKIMESAAVLAAQRLRLRVVRVFVARDWVW